MTDHHHLAQFHFGPFLTDGQIVRWGRVAHNGKLTRKLIHPAATAYVPDLYARKMVAEDQVETVERTVFGRLEDRAALVRDKILAVSLNSLTDEEWTIWGTYVNAVAFRTPEAIAMASGRAPGALHEMLDRMGHLYPALRGNNPEATAKEWLENHRAQELANAGLDAIVMNITKGGWPVERILGLRWCTVDLSAATSRLMLSDRPLIRDKALLDHDVVLALPISRTTLWLACETEDALAPILRLQARDLVEATNAASCNKAVQFVYGDADDAFVERWLLGSQTVAA